MKNWWHHETVNVELLVVPACPNEQPAAAALRTALDDVGLDAVGFRTVTVADQATAERIGFTGSPTFRVDGVDLFDDPARPVGMSCRLYARTTGVAGVPDTDDLRAALRRAVAGVSVSPSRAAASPGSAPPRPA